MRGADCPRWMSEQNVERYLATADECQTHARRARLAIDKEAWLKLVADWNALAKEAQRWVTLARHLRLAEVARFIAGYIHVQRPPSASHEPISPADGLGRTAHTSL